MMKVVIVVLLIIQGVIPKGFPPHHTQQCSEEIMNRIRIKYVREILSEVDDLEDLYGIQSAAYLTAQFKINQLLRDIANAADTVEQNGANIDECLDACKAQANSLKKSFEEELNVRCDFKKHEEYEDIMATVARATTEIEKCLTRPWSSCKSIDRCCDKIVENFDNHGDDLEDDIDNLERKYKICVRSALYDVNVESSKIRQGIKDCSQQTTQTDPATSTMESTTNQLDSSTETDISDSTSTTESTTNQPGSSTETDTSDSTSIDESTTNQSDPTNETNSTDFTAITESTTNETDSTNETDTETDVVSTTDSLETSEWTATIA